MNANASAANQIESAAKESINFLDRITNIYEQHLPKVFIALIFFAAGLVLAKIIKYIVGKVIYKSKMEVSVVHFLSQAVYLLMMCIIAVISLGIAGVPTATLVTVFGAAGVAFGLGFQNSVANLTSGVMVFFHDIYKVGDWVEFKGGLEGGNIYKINLMDTAVKTLDGKIMHVPNSLVTAGVVINYSQSPYRRLISKFAVSYDTDTDKALSILRDIYETSPYNENSSDNLYRVSSLDSGVAEVMAAGSVRTEKYMDFYYFVQEETLKRFKKENIALRAPVKFANY